MFIEITMKPNEFMVYIESKFTVCDADMGSLPHRVHFEIDKETGDSILPMPKEIYGDYADIDDVISFRKTSKYRIMLVNLSCKVIKITRFVREYNSIYRQINSPMHSLNRVILEIQGQHYLIKAIT